MTNESSVRVPVIYRREWQDGFGARGWKLESALADEWVIASTAETGGRIPTSVLVHDTLDHYLCGWPLSGHRNEARALTQLASRTGSDPTPDYARMVDEDLLQGTCNGETLRAFLPAGLRRRLPPGIDGSDAIRYLRQHMGAAALRAALVQRFSALGRAGIRSARRSYLAYGLDYQRRDEMGLALQGVLRAADTWVQSEGIEWSQGCFEVGNYQAALKLTAPRPREFSSAAAAVRAHHGSRH